MDNIEIFRNSAIILLRKLPSKIYSWTTILIFSFISFTLVSVFYKYNKIISYNAVLVNSYIEFYVSEEFFENSNMSLLINQKYYSYEIKSITPFSYYNSETEYWKITIDAKIPKKWNIENNRLLLFFEKEKTTYLSEIINFIKKGMK